jgi:transmembrane sensor
MNQGREMMDAVIVRVLKGLALPEERLRLDEWRTRHPENEQHYREVCAVWALAGEVPLAPSAQIISRAPDLDVILARAAAFDRAPAWDSGIEHQPSPVADSVTLRPAGVQPASAPRPPRHRRWGARLAMAAGIAAVAFGLGVGVNVLRSPTSGEVSEVSTGADEMTTVTLPGGTVARLGPNSTLRFPAVDEGSDRSVWLEGRAFFGVQPNPSRTFTVNTPFGEAVALGTRFEVRTGDDEFRVLVVQGLVRVSSAGAAVEIGPGGMASSASGSPPSAITVSDPEDELTWMGRTLVFRATPLSAAVAEIERRYGVDVEIAGPTLASMEVTATFSGQPLDGVVLVLCQVLNARCEMGGGQVRFEPRAP